MPLVLIESPNKIKKLSKILGSKFKVMATKGHIIDLPSDKVGVNTRNKTFDPNYVTIQGKGKIIAGIVKESAKHTLIYLATDPDREGEAIAAHIASKIPKKGKTFHRVLFSAITKPVVLKAMANPGKLNIALFDAQQARRVTDRLVGYRVSPIMWHKGLVGASAGRVQSVVLRYVVEREREIEAFVPEEYWDIDAHTNPDLKIRMYGLSGEAHTVRDGVESDDIATRVLEGNVLVVTKVKKSVTTRKPSPPFTTSTLQQAASNVFGWGVTKTMMVAQKCFEAGSITYHRTDSTSIDKEQLESLREHLKQSQGEDFTSKTKNTFKNKKGSQEAHEAIRPTGEGAESLTPEQKRLHTLIRNRYLASQMADAKYDKMTVELRSKGTSPVVNFRIVGSKVTFEGFLKVYGTKTKEVTLPNMSVGDEIPINKMSRVQKFTQPPGRYSDASLVKKMETDGVGRPATFASMIGILLKREFATKEGRSFHATKLGEMVYDYMEKFFPKLVDPKFTAEMENQLDLVANGELTYVKVLDTWYDPFKGDLKTARAGDAKFLFRTKDPCPVCSVGFMLKRPDKNGGWWYACDQHPECKTIALVTNSGEMLRDGGVIQIKVAKPDPVVGEGEVIPNCPKCDVLMRLQEGKYGKFWGCTEYKKTRCKGKMNWVDPEAPPEVIEVFPGLPCSVCSGDMQKKTGRFGEYLACATGCKGNHPVPVGSCPTCGNFAVQRYSKKKKKAFYCCWDWSERCDFVTSRFDDLKPLPTN